MSTPARGVHRLRGVGLWFARNEQLVLSVLAAIVGVVVAYGAIGFLALISIIQELSFATDLTFATLLERIHFFAENLPWWHVILVPTAGGFLIGLFLKIGYPLRSRDVNMLGWRTRHPIPKAGSTTRAP